jgi:hydroxypyruvate isomerase
VLIIFVDLDGFHLQQINSNLAATFVRLVDQIINIFVVLSETHLHQDEEHDTHKPRHLVRA